LTTVAIPDSSMLIGCRACICRSSICIITRENDPSEANLQILERQIQARQPISIEESGMATVVNIGADGPGNAQIEQIRALLIN